MSVLFEEVVDFIGLQLEGPLANDPDDPGGLTKYGITSRDYPQVKEANFSWNDAKAIYKEHYWDVCRCDEIPAAFACAIFDAAVNQGPETAITILQTALRVTPDGIMGPQTILACKNASIDGQLISFLSWRAHRYSKTHGAEKFFRGWMKRLFRLQIFCYMKAGIL